MTGCPEAGEIPCGDWDGALTPCNATPSQYDKSPDVHAYYLRVICPTCQVVVCVMHALPLSGPHRLRAAGARPVLPADGVPRIRHRVPLPLHRAGPEPGPYAVHVSARQSPAQQNPSHL